MANRKLESQRLKYMCQVALFMAIILVMKLAGLGNIPINPLLNVTLMDIPVAVGAILLGPLAGTILGITFGASSLIPPISGMILTLQGISWFHTFVMCVGMRALMGCCCGWIFRGLWKIDKTKTVSFYVSALSAALLNTIFFMGYLVLVFYQTDYIQGKVANLGAFNWLHFVVLFVGLNGLLEAGATLLVGGSVAKGVYAALHKKAKE